MRGFVKITVIGGLLCGLLVLGCKKQEAAPAEAAPAEAAPVAEASNIPPLHENNIVSIAIGSKDHTTLVAALKAADYVTSVAASGPLTVFAPTNDAFREAPRRHRGGLGQARERGHAPGDPEVPRHHVRCSTELVQRGTDRRDGQRQEGHDARERRGAFAQRRKDHLRGSQPKTECSTSSTLFCYRRKSKARSARSAPGRAYDHPERLDSCYHSLTMSKLDGKRVLITGGARGIGLEMAIKFAGRGAEVVIADINEQKLTEAKAKIEALGVAAWGFPVDVTNPASIASLRAQVAAEVGPIDVLVNNAGVVFGGPFTETPLDHHFKTYEVNVLGVVAMTHAFLPDLVDRPEAHLVNISQRVGFRRPALRLDLCIEQVGRHRFLRVDPLRAQGAGPRARAHDDCLPELHRHRHVRGRRSAQGNRDPRSRLTLPKRSSRRSNGIASTS